MATGVPKAPVARPEAAVGARGHRRTLLRGRRSALAVPVLAAVLLLWVVAVPSSPTRFLMLGPSAAPSGATVEETPYAVAQLVLAATATVVALGLTARWALFLRWWSRALVGAAGAFVTTVVAQALAPLTWLDTAEFAMILLASSVAAAVLRRRRVLAGLWSSVTVLSTGIALLAPVLGDPVVLWVFPVEIGLWQTVLSGSALITGAVVTLAWAVRHADMPSRFGSRRAAAGALAGLAVLLLALVVAAYAWREMFPGGDTAGVFRAHPATALHAAVLAGLAHAAAQSATGRAVSPGWLVYPFVAAGTVLFVSLSLLGALVVVLLLPYGVLPGDVVDPAAGIPAEVGVALAGTVLLATAAVAALRRRTTAALTALAGAAYLSGPGVQTLLSPLPGSVPIAANPVEVALAVTVLGGMLLLWRRGDPATAATLAVTVGIVSLGSIVLSDGWFAERTLPQVALAVSLFAAVLPVALRRRPVMARPLVILALLGLGWLVLGLEPSTDGVREPDLGYALLLGFPLGVAATTMMVGRHPWGSTRSGIDPAATGTTRT